MSTDIPKTALEQPPDSHRLPSGWSVKPPANERRVPSNLTACVVRFHLLLERLTVGVDLSPEGLTQGWDTPQLSSGSCQQHDD